MHGSHDHGIAVTAKNETRMGIAALLTGGFMFVELAGGIIANSLALIADAGHMLTDFAALALAWFAFRLARRPADWKRTYGFDRFQVLVAFTNGLALFVIAAWIWLVPAIRDVVYSAMGDSIALFPTLDSDIIVGQQTALIGALGGIAGAFFALVRHVSTRLDFSKQYSMWYLTNPLMGMIWGSFVFMVLRAGMLSLTAGIEPQEVTSAWVLYLLAFIIGFQQNVANDIIRRVLKIFQLQQEGQPDSTAEAV